jgi:ferritin-like metal-binding protein YciE
VTLAGDSSTGAGRHVETIAKESHLMAESGTLHDAFLDELRDAYDAEKQLTKALPKMAKAATSPVLRDAFQTHLEETRGHVDRLEQVMEGLGEKIRGKHCDGIEGIIEEGKSLMEEEFDEATMDACLIAAGQRAEHYEIAAYGTMVAWARAMGHTDAADLLQETLDEEKAADEKLTTLAEGGINEAAADAAPPEEAPAEVSRKQQARSRQASRAADHTKR